MSQDTNNSTRNSGTQGRQGGNNRNRSRNRNRNRNRNRSGQADNRGGQNNQGRNGRQGGGRQRRRQPKPAPLTFWEKLLKLIGLYKEPTRPPRRRPAAAKSNERTARGEAGKASKQERKKPSKSGRREQSRKSGAQTGDFPVESPRLYVGNLSYDATEHDLEELFKGVGTVRNIEIVYNRHTHRSRGYGFIEMLNLDEAKRAVEVLHDQPFMGRNMIVNGASSKLAQQEEQSSDESPATEESDKENPTAVSTQ